MAWIAAHSTLRFHKKTVRMSKFLGIPRVHVIGHLVTFWLWCLEHRDDGFVGDLPPEVLAEASEWEGDPVEFSKGLYDTEWISKEGYIWDWWDYAGEYLSGRYSKQPKKIERIKKVFIHGLTPMGGHPRVDTHGLTPMGVHPPYNPDNPQNQKDQVFPDGDLIEKPEKEKQTNPEPSQSKNPYKVDLTHVNLGISEAAKHRLYNRVINVFKVRGWNIDGLLPLNVFVTVAEKVKDAKPNDLYPYFQESLNKYVNENAEVLAAESKVKRTNTTSGFSSIKDVLAKTTAVALLIFGVFTSPAFAEIPTDIAVKVILTEAAGEPYRGKVGVAEVLRNRDSLQGFCGIKRRNLDAWLSRQPQKVVKDARRAWDEAKQGSNITKGATHFENVKAFGMPKWAAQMEKTAAFGSHTFFRERGKR